MVLPHFNSIKVQLEHRLKNDIFDLSIFQFHKGTIRTTYDDDNLPLFSYFNSIKVQLELSRDILTSPVKTFQFHKGTIRT